MTAQICIPSIHKATSPTRFLRKKDLRLTKEAHQPCDEFKPKTIDYLHTLGRIGDPPVDDDVVKSMIQEYYAKYGERPNVVISTSSVNNRGKGFTFKPPIGYCYVHFKHGHELGIGIAEELK